MMKYVFAHKEDHYLKLDRTSPKEKFLSKIVKNANSGDCWYLASDDGLKFKDVFYFKRKGFKAKRFSYEHFIGKVESGLKVICECGDKLCINPKHHFVGMGSDQDKADNVAWLET